MNTKSLILLTFLCLVHFSCLKDSSLKAQENTKKVIFIIVDGFSADVIETVDTPNMDEIAKIGGYTKAYVGGDKGTYSETPTISAVGYNSLLTGTWLNKHNVSGNGIKDPNYNYWNIFRIVENHNPNLKTAIFSTWLDNRTKLIGEGLKEAGTVQLDYAFDGFEYDTINFPHDKATEYISKIDEHVANETKRYIQENGPDLSWVYLQYTDNIGHSHGDSPQFHEAIRLADDQVGRIWKAVKYRIENYNEDWLIVITTDHGRNKETGKGHGGQSDRERSTWIVTNAKNTNSYFKNNPGIVDIMPSIMEHMEIEMSDVLKEEVDGTSFINDISISNLTAKREGDIINITWNSYGDSEKASIYLTTTNNFKTGGKDIYKKLDEVESKDKKATINIKDYPSDFYKIIVKTKKNTLNKWIVME